LLLLLLLLLLLAVAVALAPSVRSMVGEETGEKSKNKTRKGWIFACV
jgi:hypothetical protein